MAQTLLERSLVEEFRLMTDPVLVGGNRLFGEDRALRTLRLVDSQVTTRGVILATYTPVEGDPTFNASSVSAPRSSVRGSRHLGQERVGDFG